jgi:hypothetical protein
MSNISVCVYFLQTKIGQMVGEIYHQRKVKNISSKTTVGLYSKIACLPLCRPFL